MDNSIPLNWKKIIDKETLNKSLTRICYEIIEKNVNNQAIAIVGIRTNGEFLAKRILNKLTEISTETYDYGVLDITLYRDDLKYNNEMPLVKATDLPFSIKGKKIILIDDILYTGRTIRSALNAICDFGRPACVELAVLADRGHREFPIRPDYVGKNIPTNETDFVKVKLEETNHQEGIYLIPGESK